MSQRRTRRLRADGGTGTCDGLANNRSNPNAILARERLELFSLGEGHHSETDVREACSALGRRLGAAGRSGGAAVRPWRCGSNGLGQQVALLFGEHLWVRMRWLPGLSAQPMPE